ncbi:MAG: nicotinate phosphoribosyltransferase [Lactobacillales bacterium]|nr:nicotinate phosphoribosyltransferase [Lactobacillales bacterium]
MKIYNGYKRLARNYTLVADEYEFSMANGYLMNNKKDNEAVFDVFFRKVPNGGGYAIMAGLDKVIEYIEELKFEEKDLDYFRRKGYPEEFIEYLRNFKFTGDIYAIPDGTPVFPNEPLITVKAPLIEAQIVETAILAMVNGAMEHATGARRIVEVTPENIGVMEFGARRADGTEAAIDASIYGIMAGCIGTSNVMAADMLNIKAMGTQAHSWIESYPTEYDAFLSYAKVYPNNCILLVDTIDTLKSGIPNAIKVFNYMKENNMNTNNIGIRIDSGDLAYLSKEARRMLDEAGFPQAKICLSNGLTAETIESLISQGAKFDILGVGDNISKPEGRMGCVYKEVALKETDEWVPKIKLSNDTIKIVNPDYKKLYRAYDKETGYAIADIMTRRDEKINKEDLIIVSPTDYLKRTTINNFELVELQKPIFKNGVLVYEDPEIMEKQKYCKEQMETIYPEVRRTKMPHEYYVDGTENYVNFKNNMIIKAKQMVKK